MRKRPNKRYEMFVDPNTLNPNQFLVHSRVVDKHADSDRAVSVYPAPNGRWEVLDGHHLAHSRWTQGRPVKISYHGGHGMPAVHPEPGSKDAPWENPMRMEDLVVVHPGQENRPIDVDHLVEQGKVPDPYQDDDGDWDGTGNSWNTRYYEGPLSDLEG